MLDYKAKIRLGDEIQVRNKIRTIERGIGFSSSQDKDKRDRGCRRDSIGDGEHYQDQKEDKENKRHVDENKKTTKQEIEKKKVKEKENGNEQKQKDENDDKHKDEDTNTADDKAKDKVTEEEKEEEISQDRPVYHARHTDLRQNGPSDLDSDSDLDMDPFNAKPLGLPKKGSSSTTTTSSRNGDVPPVNVIDCDSSSSEDSRSDREDIEVSKGCGVNDSHQRATDSKSISKKKTAVHNSKPWNVTDEEREKYKHLFVERPVLTHTSTNSSSVVGPGKLVESKEESASKTKVATPRVTGESKWKDDKRKTDFFNLSQQGTVTDSPKGRSKAGTERRHTSPSPSPSLGRKRLQKSECSTKTKSSSKAQRFIKSSQSMRSRGESSSPLRETQGEMDPRVYDLVTPSPRALSDAERANKGSSTKSPSRKRSKPQLSDISSDDDDAFFHENSPARRSVRSPHRTPTKMMPTSTPNDRSALQGSPLPWTPRSGEAFKLPSPTKKRLRRSSPGDLALLSDEDDIPGIGNDSSFLSRSNTEESSYSVIYVICSALV
jgi:hypothetical protein